MDACIMQQMIVPGPILLLFLVFYHRGRKFVIIVIAGISNQILTSLWTLVGMHPIVHVLEINSCQNKILTVPLANRYFSLSQVIMQVQYRARSTAVFT